MNVPDNYDRWVIHDREQEEALQMLPVCDICSEHIQEEYCYQIDGKVICEHCMVEYFRKDTMWLIE